MAQQEISEVIAERDRLRAFALSYIRWHDQLCKLHQRKPDHRTSTPLPGMEARKREAEEALANTSPAPVESVNKELLDLARNVGGSDDWFETCADLRKLRATLREFQAHARAAIAKAEKAGA